MVFIRVTQSSGFMGETKQNRIEFIRECFSES